MSKLLKAIYHSEKEVAEFIAEDGRHLLRSGGTLPWRIFNCGDLVSPINSQGEPNPKHTKNYIGFAHGKISGNNFFIFPDYETGRAELKASLKRKYAESSIKNTINKYAPSHQNDTQKYIDDVCRLTNLDEDTKLNALDETQLDQLIDAIERVEGYHNEADTRKEIWVNVSHIQATDGTRPISGEEIVVKTNEKEIPLKSNAIGYFPPIVHNDSTEVFHKTVDAALVKLGSLPASHGQHFSLITKVAEFFAPNGPVKPTPPPISGKHPLTYTVQPGDTLSKIATKFKIPLKQLKQDNHLTKDTILAGQVLGIHTQAPVIIEKTPPKKAAPKIKKEHKKHITPSITESVKSARSKEGTGEPLALITPEEGVAPWMKYAIAEAKRWHGEPEWVIEKGKPADDKTHSEKIEAINYHTELGYKSRSMASVAWCAAFVNWCLMQAGYPIDKMPHSGRAKSFYMHNDSDTQNPMYIEIDEPIYGAIGMVDHGNGKYHVGFVYAKDINNQNYIIILGGNQHDRIQFSPFQIKQSKDDKDHLQYFIPASYAESVKKQGNIKLSFMDRDELNTQIGITSSKGSNKKIKPESTR